MIIVKDGIVGNHMENQWLTWAKQLQGIASTGLFYVKDPYDADRYNQIAEIAHQMLAQLADTPVGRIESLFSDFAEGYATPGIDVRGAVLRDNKILLVRESSDGLWTMPGGFADIGISPKENVIKEIREEACLDVTADGLYGIRYKARHDYDQDVRDFYKLFFLCRDDGTTTPTPSGLETVDVRFFGADELPQLSTGRVLEKDIIDAFRYDANGGHMVFCD